jgi:threonine dehydratase
VPADTWPITFDDVLAARERIRPYLQPTPLRRYAALDEVVGHGIRVWVKHENHNPTNAFKARNAMSVLSALPKAAGRRGVITPSRGNHGQGLAWAGGLLGIPVTVCVPIGNNPEKNEAMRGFGADVIEEGADYDESVEVALRIQRERGQQLVHPSNDPAIVAGAGTYTLEIVEELADLDAMVIAVGGGSQAVGAMTVARARAPKVRVFGVQAERAAAIHDSWHAGKTIVRESADTIADGLATRMPYEGTFPALSEGLAGFVAVSEREIADAVRVLLRTTHNLAEGAGAGGFAGLRRLADELAGKSVAVVISGGNIDAETLRRIVNREI